jgi:hypothetical protein
MTTDDRIRRLVDRVREITEDNSAPPWGDLWDQSSDTQNVSMFAFPNPIAGTGQAPFVFAPDANFFSRLFGYSLKEVFTDARTWICFSLEQMVWNHEHLHHDGGASKTILINQLGFFPPSLFGMMPIYDDDAVPWIKEPVIQDQADFAELKEPDFHTSGLSPLVHRMYEEARSLLPDDFEVEFTTWLTGPFSLIFHLRGPLNLAQDVIDDPDFVHEMMAFATHCMKTWWTERAKFLGQDTLEPLIMGDDEVGVPMISPAHYEEFVLPYETDLSVYFGGIDYWHSCSNVTLMLPHIARIPNLRMMDVGPWTALQPAVELFGQRPGSSIMKRLHPVSEVLMASEDQMRSRLLEIKATCYDVPYMLFFDGLNVLDSVEESMEKVLLLDRVCHEVLHNDPARPSVAPEHGPAR